MSAVAGEQMKKYFEKKRIPIDVQKKYSEALLNDTWDVLVDFLEQDARHQDDKEIALLYAYALIYSAATIHIDSVAEFSSKAIDVLERFQPDERVTAAVGEIKRLLAKKKRQDNKVLGLLKKDLSTIAMAERKNIAYLLSESSQKDALQRSAEIFHQIFVETGDLYSYCNYLNLSHKSGSSASFLEDSQKILQLPSGVFLENRSDHVAYIYQNMLDYHKNDKSKFLETWQAALSDQYIKRIPSQYVGIKNSFPISDNVFDAIYKTASGFCLTEICEYLKRKYLNEKIEVSKSTLKLMGLRGPEESPSEGRPPQT
jgi:hypothetical protein